MISLTVGPTTLTLHPDLYWEDEHSWNPVEQKVDFSLTGALIVQVAARLAGRPVTLKPIDQSSAWSTRAQLLQLQAWAAIPGQEMTLSYNGTSSTVIFRHQDGALLTEPIAQYNDADVADWFLVTIRLMEV